MDGQLISIIVACYNVEKYLDRCVDSIVRQSYSNLEIILVDDGATDKTGEICDKWVKKDARVKVLHRKMEDSLMPAMRASESPTGNGWDLSMGMIIFCLRCILNCMHTG